MGAVDVVLHVSEDLFAVLFGCPVKGRHGKEEKEISCLRFILFGLDGYRFFFYYYNSLIIPLGRYIIFQVCLVC